ncbi:hypothetical protein ACBJ59_60375 [Nonomuraea sp. MTCD27]|uniref:hypothetical protein n=1 Tax=Nonomuraea sp. MTCD27 TaxID=1676747 RepID=UPI0035C20A64
MIGDLWTGATGKLTERLVSASIPALVFWCGGLLAWIDGRDGLDDLAALAGQVDRQPAATQFAILFAIMVAIGASAILVRRCTLPVLRLLEGYWPRLPAPLTRLHMAGVSRARRQAGKDSDRFQELMDRRDAGELTLVERTELIRLDQRARRRPSSDWLMPTRIGNILRAAESRPVDKYGLDVVQVWPHLWMLLPDTARQELSSARTALDSAVGAGIWSLLFLAFAPWSLWAIPVGLGTAWAAWRFWAADRAVIYANVVEAVFDLYRTALYEQLRWPLPATPNQERAEGRRITTYLLRGSDADHPVFGTPAAENDSAPADNHIRPGHDSAKAPP